MAKEVVRPSDVETISAEALVIRPDDAGTISASALVGDGEPRPDAQPHVIKSRTAKVGKEDATIIRAANSGDGEGFDPKTPQLLVRMADGTKRIVSAADAKPA